MLNLKILYITTFGLLVLLSCPSKMLAQTATCASVVPGDGTASCMSACGGLFPVPWTAGDAGCASANSTLNKCCGKAAIITPTTNETQATNQAVAQSAEASFPTFASLIKLSHENVIGNIIKGLLGLTGTVTIIMLVYGGLLWMTAAGNDKAVSKAKQIIVWTAVGLVLIFSSYAILNFLFSSLRS